MNQQVGDEDLSQKSNYGKSIEEAKSLIKQLEAFKNTPATLSDKKEGDATVSLEQNDKNDMVTYELFYTPETAKMQKEGKLSEIDERIAKIEKLVGSNAGQALDELVSEILSIVDNTSCNARIYISHRILLRLLS